MVLFHSFLWLNNVPFCNVCVYCVCICIHAHTHTHTHTPPTPSLFICQWVSGQFRLLPCPGYCKQCCCTHWGCMYLYKLEFSLDICPGVGLEDHTGNSDSSFLRDLRTAFHSERESEVTQLCLTLWDSMDCSPQGSSVHGISQARVLEWVASSFSRGSSQSRNRTRLLHWQADSFLLSHQESLEFLL